MVRGSRDMFYTFNCAFVRHVREANNSQRRGIGSAGGHRNVGRSAPGRAIASARQARVRDNAVVVAAVRRFGG